MLNEVMINFFLAQINYDILDWRSRTQYPVKGVGLTVILKNTKVKAIMFLRVLFYNPISLK